MGLSEQIATKGVPEEPLREPPLLRPEQGDEGQKSPFASPKFVQYLANKGERWKGICLKPVPHLEKSVRARCHGVVQGRKVNRETVVEACSEKTDRDRPHRLQFVYQT